MPVQLYFGQVYEMHENRIQFWWGKALKYHQENTTHAAERGFEINLARLSWI